MVAIFESVIAKIDSLMPPGRFLKVQNDTGNCHSMNKSEVLSKIQKDLANTNLIAARISRTNLDNTDPLASTAYATHKRKGRPMDQPATEASKSRRSAAAKRKAILKNIASFNLPAVQSNDSVTITEGRPKRQRTTVTFFEPEGNHIVRKSKRMREAASSATNLVSAPASSKRVIRSKSRRPLPTSKTRTSERKRNRNARLRLSKNITRRVITNAVLCYEQRKANKKREKKQHVNEEH
eukprot:jgi/Psemu1/310350/fgenesh1_kg.625_\